jgi:hypothetical protein
MHRVLGFRSFVSFGIRILNVLQFGMMYYFRTRSIRCYVKQTALSLGDL